MTATAGQMALDRQKEIPAWVRFIRVPETDHDATRAKNKLVSKDVDYALITPPYSKDEVRMRVDRWLEIMEQDVRSDRMKPEWRDNYIRLYEKFKAGEELPIDGTPIKGWGVLSPAQQKNIIATGILTVEVLAQANAEGLARIGMGSQDLKNKAQAWLSQLNDKGPLTIENAALKRENDHLKGVIEALEKTNANLQRDLRIAQMQVPQGGQLASSYSQDISAADLGLNDRI